MEIRPIKTEADYESALERLEEIFGALPGSKEGDEVEILSILIDKYESENYPIDFPDPIEAIKFRMEQLDYSSSELIEIFGQASRVSEVLNRKRKLSLNMIRRITDQMQIPLEVLIRAY